MAHASVFLGGGFPPHISGYWVALGFAWSCPLACLGRADMADPAAVHLIQMIDAISAATGDTMLTTATASASEDVEAGAKWFNTTQPPPIFQRLMCL